MHAPDTQSRHKIIYIYICTICMISYLYINNYIIYMIYVNHMCDICDPTDPGELINNSRRLNTIRKIM